ncbi:cupin domain-containing protein [Acinetobacter sp. CAAS 2-6]|uniref:cupin domain-containing protein n=1 Tax=Acinetobacter sp. CAAS 2-6 TaxID=3016358 RepID=UPI002DD69D2E|nr:cupin domain-containing protein [Acinetobacter sp. CAAS 2-6]
MAHNSMIRVNDDLSVATIVHARQQPWIDSPAQGVKRRILYRVGNEKARATSIVEYAAGSQFPQHIHSGGEEFLVLKGIFQDEHGDYPAGSYVRNPPGSMHTPRSDQGCTILVKLWQFRQDDHQRISILPSNDMIFSTQHDHSMVLFNQFDEEVRLESWCANTTRTIINPSGLEVFVVSGSFQSGPEIMETWSWIRLPAGMPLELKVGAQGACVWIKSAPLEHINVCRFEIE